MKTITIPELRSKLGHSDFSNGDKILFTHILQVIAENPGITIAQINSMLLSKSIPKSCVQTKCIVAQMDEGPPPDYVGGADDMQETLNDVHDIVQDAAKTYDQYGDKGFIYDINHVTNRSGSEWHIGQNSRAPIVDPIFDNSLPIMPTSGTTSSGDSSSDAWQNMPTVTYPVITPSNNPYQVIPQTNTGTKGSTTTTTTSTTNSTTNVTPTIVTGQGVDTAASTNFVADAPTAKARVGDPSAIPRSLIEGDVGAKFDDIRGFLAKPYLVSAVGATFSSSDTTTTSLTSFDYFDPLVIGGSLENTLATAKLKGIWSMRADIRVRVVVNANVFQQGRYMIVFIPTGGACCNSGSSNNNATNWIASLTYDLTRITQLPHVEFDLNDQTEAVLEIPYQSITTHWGCMTGYGPDTQTIFGSPGKFKIMPYKALSTGSTGSTNASYQVFVEYFNVEFSTSAIPQMAVHDEEQKSSGTGPISSTASTVSQVAGVVGNAVPALSAITKPVQWASDLVAGLATMFGYSSPLNLDVVNKNSLTWFPNHLNVDAPDNSAPISLMARNSIQPMSGVAGTDIDEMSFDFIKQVPAFWKQYSVTTSTTAGSNIFWIPVNPGLWQTQYTVTNSSGNIQQGQTVSPASLVIRSRTPAGFLSTLFAEWRGSHRFKLKFVKTQFHSARFALVYQPTANLVNGTGTPTYANTIFAHREIFDMRTANQFDFSVPFTSVTPYIPLNGTNNEGGECGYLGLYLINPLVAPASVSTTISIMLEVAGGPDMEFAVPKIGTSQYVMVGSTQSQMDSEGLVTNDKFVGETFGSPHTVNPARFCVGEKLTSFLQLIKSAYPTLLSTTPSNNYINLSPAAIPVDYAAAGSGTITYYYNNTSTNNETFPDIYARTAMMYTFSRGGFRVRLFSTSAGTNVNPFIASAITNPYQGSGYKGITGDSTYPNTQLSVVQNQAFTGGVEVQIPNYSISFARANLNLIYNNTASTLAASQYDGTNPMVYLHAGTIGSNLSNVSIMRSCSDDFQMFGFVGAPLSAATS